MIKIKKQGNLISISGHADYAESNDIVCASISSIMYTTVNAIMNFDSKSIIYNDDNNEVTIEIVSEDNITSTLIDNMMTLFKDLESKYPSNIKISKEEM